MSGRFAPPKVKLGRCRSCHASVRWVTIIGTGRAMPLDAEPVESGTVRVFSGDRAVVETEGAAEVLRASHVPLYVSHFATCPNAEAHRRKR